MVAVLLVGQGAREHALAYKISQSPLLTKLHLWPGHGGMTSLGTLWKDLPATFSPLSTDFSPLIQKCRQEKIDLVVVGPETPLSQGLADQLLSARIKVFGPQQAAAKLETDKAFAKTLMAEAGIPTATYRVTHSERETRDQAVAMLQASGGVVIKAAGLASGKGVFVCRDLAAIDEGLKLLFQTEMRSAADTVVLEEILVGRECSYFVFLGTSIETTVPIGFAVDYKRLLDRDLGPNTGGMGCYTPVPWLPKDAENLVQERIVTPLLATLRHHHIPYCGCLYVGIMWSKDGPKVVEFNVRLGDPEAQSLVLQDTRDWLALMLHCADFPVYSTGFKTNPSTPIAPPRFTVGVVMTSASYPYGKDRGIPGKIPHSLFESSSQGQVFAASLVEPPLDPNNRDKGDHRTPTLETGTGRVLTVMGQGTNFDEARKVAYQKVKTIHEIWPQGCFRTDIAQNTAISEGSL